MNSPVYIVASRFDWNANFFDKFSKQQKGIWYFASNPSELDELLETYDPRYIFFPHWSWLVSDEVISKYECVCFHMTDLPFGRGGSPLQNLILHGYQETILTSFRMEKTLDSGPVYYKRPLSLDGSAYEIYKRAGRLCWDIINDLIKNNPNPSPQKGVVYEFKRREYKQSSMPINLSLKEVYNFIRMLDAPGYPKAYLDIGDYRLEFESSNFFDGKLTAKTSFKKRENND